VRLLKRAVHIDFHTLPGITDIGANFTAVDLADTLHEAKVDYINAFAKCNIGFTYYPSEVGPGYPGLTTDLFGDTVTECHARGIGVTAYFNIGLDHEMARLHRDWTVVEQDGHVISGDRSGNFFRNMCINSPYADYMLAMITEVVDRYPVDGVFLDCMIIRPCHGNECLEDIVRRGGDPLDARVVADFARERWRDFTERVKDIIGEDRFLVPNGLPWELTDGLRTHGEIECLPSGPWGYDFFPARVAYARNVDPQVLYMTGRFDSSWGEFGGLKSAASLRNDCWDAISNAAQTSIGDHMHPRDGLEPEVYAVVREIYGEIEALEPWTECATAVADIGILTWEGRQLSSSHDGAARMLGELKYTYDVIDERHDFSRYAVLVLPDGVVVTPALAAKLSTYLAASGRVLSSGTSGLDGSGAAFALPEWGMTADGPDPWNISYFTWPQDGAAGTRRPMPHSIEHQAILLAPDTNGEVVVEYWEPYFNRVWDGFHGYFYAPPDRPSGRPAVVRSGNVIQCCFNVFSGYLTGSSPAYRGLVRHCLEQLLPEPSVVVEGLPHTARMTMTRQDGRRMVHVKLTHPEGRTGMPVVEDYPTVLDSVVRVRADQVGTVYTAPDRQSMPYTVEDGYARIEIPRIDGYALLVVED